VRASRVRVHGRYGRALRGDDDALDDGWMGARARGRQKTTRRVRGACDACDACVRVRACVRVTRGRRGSIGCLRARWMMDSIR